jgi:hypothetical protein
MILDSLLRTQNSEQLFPLELVQLAVFFLNIR